MAVKCGTCIRQPTLPAPPLIPAAMPQCPLQEIEISYLEEELIHRCQRVRKEYLRLDTELHTLGQPHSLAHIKSVLLFRCCLSGAACPTIDSRCCSLSTVQLFRCICPTYSQRSRSADDPERRENYLFDCSCPKCTEQVRWDGAESTRLALKHGTRTTPRSLDHPVPCACFCFTSRGRSLPGDRHYRRRTPTFLLRSRVNRKGSRWVTTDGLVSCVVHATTCNDSKGRSCRCTPPSSPTLAKV